MNVSIVLGVDNVMVTLLPHCLLKKNQIRTGYWTTLFDLAVKRHALVSVKKDKEQEYVTWNRKSKGSKSRHQKVSWLGFGFLYAQKSPPVMRKFEKAGLQPSDFQTEGEYTPSLCLYA